MTNWARRTVGGELKRYEYPRYFFSNKSTDTLGLCCAALDRLGIAQPPSSVGQVWVARREAAAGAATLLGRAVGCTEGAATVDRGCVTERLEAIARDRDPFGRSCNAGHRNAAG